jgi:hypothetical protein
MQLRARSSNAGFVRDWLKEKRRLVAQPMVFLPALVATLPLVSPSWRSSSTGETWQTQTFIELRSVLLPCHVGNFLDLGSNNACGGSSALVSLWGRIYTAGTVSVKAIAHCP